MSEIEIQRLEKAISNLATVLVETTVSKVREQMPHDIPSAIPFSRSVEPLMTKKAAESPVNVAPKLLYDVKGAAEQLSVSVPSIRKLIRQGRLPRVQGVRKILVPREALKNFAAKSTGADSG